MPDGIHDIAIWETLHREDASVDDLVATLTALAAGAAADRRIFVGPLLRMLNHQHPGVREWALRGLAANLNRAAVQQIHRLLADDVAGVRRAAVETLLGAIKGDPADLALMLFSPHADVRAAALHGALEWSNPPLWICLHAASDSALRPHLEAALADSVLDSGELELALRLSERDCLSPAIILHLFDNFPDSNLPELWERFKAAMGKATKEPELADLEKVPALRALLKVIFNANSADSYKKLIALASSGEMDTRSLSLRSLMCEWFWHHTGNVFVRYPECLSAIVQLQPEVLTRPAIPAAIRGMAIDHLRPNPARSLFNWESLSAIISALAHADRLSAGDGILIQLDGRLQLARVMKLMQLCKIDTDAAFRSHLAAIFGEPCLLAAMAEDTAAAVAFLLGGQALEGNRDESEIWIQRVLNYNPPNLNAILAGFLRQRPLVSQALWNFFLSVPPILAVASELAEDITNFEQVDAMQGDSLTKIWVMTLSKALADGVLQTLAKAGLLIRKPFAIVLLRSAAKGLLPDRWIAQFNNEWIQGDRASLLAILGMIDADPQFPFEAEHQLVLHLVKQKAVTEDPLVTDWLSQRKGLFSKRPAPPTPRSEERPDLLTLARRHYSDEWATIEFGNQLLEQGRPLEDVLREASANPSKSDREDIWATVERLHGFWRSRPPEAKETYAALHTHRFADVLLIGLADPVTALSAAKIFRFVHWFLKERAFLDYARPKVESLMPSLAVNVREVLAPWVSSAGLPTVSVGTGTADAPDWIRNFSIASSENIPQLQRVCRLGIEHLVDAACKRLIQLGNRGLAAMATLFAEDPVPPGVVFIAETFPFWPTGPVVDAVHRCLIDNAYPAQVQFCLARALLEQSEFAFLPALLNAIASAEDRYTITNEDWSRVLNCGVDKQALAIAAIGSPHPAVYTSCMPIVVEMPCSQASTDALLAFLKCGTQRLLSLRIQVAHCLWQRGLRTVAPVLLQAWWEKYFNRDAHPYDSRKWLARWIASSEETVVVDLFVGMALTRLELSKNKAVFNALDSLGDAKLESAKQGRILQRIIPMLDDSFLRGVLIDIRSRCHSGKVAFLRPLAELFMAGHDDALRLLGRRFEIEIIHEPDRLGFTRMDEDVVHVNPLPMLLGKPHGREIVHGLILHELGHHCYHRGDGSQRVFADAQREGIFSLLNLVSDEHLERNLRAVDSRYGNHLKLLAAYAFQHSDRSIPVEDLLKALGPDAFPTLVACRLSPARKRDAISVHNGQLLASASAHLPFARFVRALRMGLGNRDRDPTIARALKLFQGKAFRHASMPRLLEIARELRDLFGAEGNDPESLTHAAGQDGLFSGQSSESEDALSGIDNAAIRAEIERIRSEVTRIHARLPRPQSSENKGIPAAVINIGDDTDFQKIHRIVQSRFDAEAYRRLAEEVRFEVRRLRPFFALLGVRPRYDGGRSSGRTIDRQRLLALVARREPRVLRARILERKTGLHLGVLVDCSGSMVFDDNIAKARRFAALIAEATRGLSGVESRFWGFTDSVIYDAGNARRCAAAALKAGGGNNDGAALWHAARTALASRHKTRLLVMISDGMPTECSVAALRQLVNQLTRNHGICCLQVAVRPIEEVAFPHYVELKDNHSISASVRAFGQLILQRIKAIQS